MQRFLLIAVFFLIAPVLAQANLIPTYNSALQLGMSPQYPKPGDAVTLTVVNYSGGADSTTYTWSVNGTTVLSGIGEKTLTVLAGALGSTQEISVVAEQNGTPAGSASAVIHPADVDIVWEGQTSTPPFFIGRPLPNAASRVTILAVPHILSGGGELLPGSLIYSWQENGVPLSSVSGYGKSAVVVTPPRFGEAFTVSVHVANTNGTVSADGSAVITPQKPMIAVYEHAPLLGVRFEKNISNTYPFTGEEISFSAFPFFVANLNALTYQWTLDGQSFTVDPKSPREVTFRKVGNAAGEHAVTFSFTNPGGFLEQASASFKLTF